MSRSILSLTGLVALLICGAPALGQDLTPAAAEEAGSVSEALSEELESEEAELAARLSSILGAVDALDDVSVQVNAGIVTLRGRAPSREPVEQVAELARKLDGVLLVLDEVEVESSLSRRFSETADGVVLQVRELVAAAPMYAAALGILVVAWLLARFLRDAKAPYRVASSRELLQNLLRQTVFVAVLLLGVVAALKFLGAGAVIGTILGAAGVLGIAVGFAFRNVIENYLAGVLLALRQPFSARDVVRIGDSNGTVLRMTASETILLDADGNHVRLPNAVVFNGTVVNFTRNPLRRFRISVGIGTNVDLDRAQRLGEGVLERMKGVKDDPAPSSRVAGFGDSTVTVEFYGWVDQQEASYLKVASEAHRLIKEEFDGSGVDTPNPAYTVQLDGAPVDPAPARERREERPAPPSGDRPEQIEVSPESDLDRQVERELARSDEENLLEEE